MSSITADKQTLENFPSDTIPYQDDNDITESIQDEEEEKPFSYFDVLDVVKPLPDPVELTFDHLKQIGYELGLIKLCWPDVIHPIFENRTNFPARYLTNNDKEKAVLLYAENFRRQFCYKFPNRKPMFLACENECGIQKMVCTTIRPTTLPYPELETWENCARFVADHLKYEPLHDPTLLPHRLYSPHTTFLRQSGHSFELATALCSLLIGVGYDAYVVSGYAIKDVTLRIMSRVDCPHAALEEDAATAGDVTLEEKYKLKPPRDLRSKFLLMMEQRAIDKANEEARKLAEQERLKILEEEKRPPDDLEGQRIHSWVLLISGERQIQETVFIEPSTGFSHRLDTDLYCGIESVWNHLNYWVNMQDCTHGLASIEYNLTDVEKWEHFLVGEPLNQRKHKPKELEEEDTREMYDEKHLDMPISWSMRISIPHEALKKRYPEGMKTTYYKYTLVEEYGPYVLYDGLMKRIVRYKEFNCKNALVTEEYFDNRKDKLNKSLQDHKNNSITEYFQVGREDGIIKHVFYKNRDAVDDERTIFFNHEARYDALRQIQVEANTITEHYGKRDDKLYFRQVTYSSKNESNKEGGQGVRRPILKIIQKYERDENKPAGEDIAIREFAIIEREIHIKFHYGKGNVTASTRTFIKPPISEMGEGMVFKPELTFGYQAEIGAKPPRQLTLFLLFEEQLKEEENVLNSIRDMEMQISEFLLTRAHEMAFSKLEISIFNKEQNMDFRSGMLEKEQQQRACKEKEVEEETDYLAPYMAKLGNPRQLTYQQALDAKYACLDDFKRLLLERANTIQRAFEKMSDQLQNKKNYYTTHHDTLTPEEEAAYFEEVNNLITYLRTMEIRLARHKDLSPLRYQDLMTYLNSHPLLEALN